jgi:hypothetical protein
VVRYEELVTAPARTIGALCDHLAIDYDPALVRYGDRPPPAGRMGDDTGVPRHPAPTAASLDKWRELRHDPQLCHLALAYLDALGPELVERLGYPHEALRQALVADARRPVAPLAPWSIVSRPQRSWSRAEHARVAAAHWVQSEGWMRGLASLLRHRGRSVCHRQRGV